MKLKFSISTIIGVAVAAIFVGSSGSAQPSCRDAFSLLPNETPKNPKKPRKNGQEALAFAIAEVTAETKSAPTTRTIKSLLLRARFFFKKKHVLIAELNGGTSFLILPYGRSYLNNFAAAIAAKYKADVIFDPAELIAGTDHGFVLRRRIPANDDLRPLALGLGAETLFMSRDVLSDKHVLRMLRHLAFSSHAESSKPSPYYGHLREKPNSQTGTQTSAATNSKTISNPDLRIARDRSRTRFYSFEEIETTQFEFEFEFQELRRLIESSAPAEQVLQKIKMFQSMLARENTNFNIVLTRLQLARNQIWTKKARTQFVRLDGVSTAVVDSVKEDRRQFILEMPLIESYGTDDVGNRELLISQLGWLSHALQTAAYYTAQRLELIGNFDADSASHERLLKLVNELEENNRLSSQHFKQIESNPPR